MDERIKKLAKILTDYSIKIKKKDTILIESGIEAKELLLEIAKNIIKKGAFPRINLNLPGFSYLYFKYAKEWQLRTYPKISDYEIRHCNGIISINTDYNTKELTSIDPRKITLRKKITKPISDFIIKQDNWVITEYPTNALAQDAEMSLSEFEDFYFNSVLLDWKKESKKYNKLKKILDKAKKVRIIGEDTDISFSIKNRKAIVDDGKRNMPGGEVYIAPEEKTTQGFISYDFPAIFNGKEVSGIKLWFKNGKVVKAKADKNEDMLKAAINTDKGSKYLGEFGIGLNYNIKKFVKQILFDEKIGGTIHLALGMAYPEGGGKNKSAIHWDMIKDLRKKGEILVDDKVIQKNGKWKIRF